MNVHLLRHIRHARRLDGSHIEHRDVDGELKDTYTLDDGCWTDGFVSIPRG